MGEDDITTLGGNAMMTSNALCANSGSDTAYGRYFVFKCESPQPRGRYLTIQKEQSGTSVDLVVAEIFIKQLWTDKDQCKIHIIS